MNCIDKVIKQMIEQKIEEKIHIELNSLKIKIKDLEHEIAYLKTPQDLFHVPRPRPLYPYPERPYLDRIV